MNVSDIEQETTSQKKSKYKLFIPHNTLLISRIVALAIVYFFFYLALTIFCEDFEIFKFTRTNISSVSILSIIKIVFPLWIIGSLISIFVVGIFDFVKELRRPKLDENIQNNGI